MYHRHRPTSRLHCRSRIASLFRMKIHVSLWMLCLAASLSLAQDTKPTTPSKFGPTVEIPAEPSHHLKIENEYIRAYYAEVAPQQSTLMHHHGTDYIGVSLGPNEIDSTSPDGKVKHVVFEDGQVTYTPAGVVHAFTDRASTPFRNATIELLQNHGGPVCVNNCARRSAGQGLDSADAGIKVDRLRRFLPHLGGDDQTAADGVE